MVRACDVTVFSLIIWQSHAIGTRRGRGLCNRRASVALKRLARAFLKNLTNKSLETQKFGLEGRFSVSLPAFQSPRTTSGLFFRLGAFSVLTGCVLSGGIASAGRS